MTTETAETPAIAFGRRLRFLGSSKMPWLLVAGTIVFNLWTLRAQISTVLYANDSSVHLAMVRWAAQRIANGETPLDGWFPYLSLGWPLFHHYPSLPHVLTGFLATLVGAERAYAWALYVLLASWPLSVYWGSRIFRLSPWQAAAAALVSPLLISSPGYGYEHGTYTWLGLGAWAQLWGMWIFPVALSLSWRSVSQGRLLLGAAITIGAAIVSHGVEAYLALVALFLWVAITPREWITRLVRAFALGIAALGAAAWFLLPYLADLRLHVASAFFENSIFVNSYGARKVLSWLLSGELFDNQRLPAITILAGAGALVALYGARREENYRAILAVAASSLILFFGRPFLGPLVKLLPLQEGLLFHRFIAGVHMSGVWLAGIGLASVAAMAGSFIARLIKSQPLALAGAAMAAFLLLFPAWNQVQRQGATELRFVMSQQLQEFSDGRDVKALVEVARARGGGRVYAGMPHTWGREYRIGYVPVYNALLHLEADAIGFLLRVPSFTQDVETKFNETDPLHYDLFNVRYILAPSERKPQIPAALVASQGRHSLWEVGTSGYLDVADSSNTIYVDSSASFGRRVSEILSSPALETKRLPAVELADVATHPVVTSSEPVQNGSPGEVARQNYDLTAGFFMAEVRMGQPGIALLKSSYHTRWRAAVDGTPIHTFMVAPGLVAAPLPPGDHSVAFAYEPYDEYPLLFILGFLTVFAVAIPLTRLVNRWAAS